MEAEWRPIFCPRQSNYDDGHLMPSIAARDWRERRDEQLASVGHALALIIRAPSFWKYQIYDMNSQCLGHENHSMSDGHALFGSFIKEFGLATTAQM